MREGRTRYVSEAEKRQSQGCCLVVLGIITVGLCVMAIKSWSDYNDLRDTVLKLDPQIADPQSPSSWNDGRVIHVASANVKTPRPVADPAFGISLDGGLKLRRESEYCQWIETSIDTTRQDENGRKWTERTYYYTKGWRSAPIMSLFFNQPAAHHNPQRDPFPSAVADVVSATVGAYNVPAPLVANIRAKETTLRWDPGHLGFFYQSPAFNQHKFFYTANDGWFYSAYEPSTTEMLIKGAMQYAEGSLLNFQIGDLFSTCNAGDIRTRFQAVLPDTGISVIAKQVSSAVPAEVTTFTSVGGNEMAWTHAGLHSVDEMVQTELDDSRFKVRLFSSLTVISLVITVLFGRHLANIKSKPQ